MISLLAAKTIVFYSALLSSFAGAVPLLISDLPDLRQLSGNYHHVPYQNGFHNVQITVSGVNQDILWTNHEGFSWSLKVRNNKLFSGPDCIYGVQQIKIKGTSDGSVTVLIFNDEKYETDLSLFYKKFGGRSKFPSKVQKPLDAFIDAENQVRSGEYAFARSKVQALFKDMPAGDKKHWDSDKIGEPEETNIGHPIAYYGLRMIDQITAAAAENGNKLPSGKGTMQITAVVSTCGIVTRPTNLPNLKKKETVELPIDPRILRHDGRLLFDVTYLLRQWVQAITGGVNLKLVIHEPSKCSVTKYEIDEDNDLVSVANWGEILQEVPEEVQAATQFWFVLSPSGITGDGSGFKGDWITGGQGADDLDFPAIIGDDKGLLTKVARLGKGDYTALEHRTYMPTLFQHEFMHYVFYKWPQFRLEPTDHDWFNRKFWPSDFKGNFEPDYFYEAIEKRIKLPDTRPPLANGLMYPLGGPRVSISEVEGGLDSITGNYNRLPIQNDWHDIQMVRTKNGFQWKTKDNFRWSVDIKNDFLVSGKDDPYDKPGRVIDIVKNLDNGEVLALYYRGERFARDDAPTPAPTPKPTGKPCKKKKKSCKKNHQCCGSLVCVKKKCRKA